MGGSGSESDFGEEEDAPDEEGVRHLEEEPWNGISGSGGDVDMDMEDLPDDDDDEQPSSTRSPSASPPPQLVPAVSAPSLTELDPASAPTPGKYVPPALRARMAAEAAAAAGGTSEADLKKKEEMLKVEKTVNGLLNRLGESNIEAILGDLEGVYRKFPRNGASSLDPVLLDRSLNQLSRFCRRHHCHHEPHPRHHLGALKPARILRRALRCARRRSLQDHGHRIRCVVSRTSVNSRLGRAEISSF